MGLEVSFGKILGRATVLMKRGMVFWGSLHTSVLSNCREMLAPTHDTELRMGTREREKWDSSPAMLESYWLKV